MHNLNLYKFHAYGNDFLVTEEAIPEPLVERIAKASCHRHFGIGADGLLLLGPGESSDYSLRIINADGSEAGMSGNGGRCAAAYLHQVKGFPERTIRFSTISGRKVYTLEEGQDEEPLYLSLMGFPRFRPDQIPFRCDDALESIENFPLETGAETVSVSVLSVGNPQCVVFREYLPDSAEQERLGRALENHPSFPERTNVSFVKILSPEHIRIKIWERGVGITSSSGTGSCGAAIASIRSGKTGTRVAVETDTGTQQVEWSRDSEIRLTGNVSYVARIEFRFPE